MELTHKHDDNERQKEEQERLNQLEKDPRYFEFLKTNVWKKIFLEAAAQGFPGICICIAGDATVFDTQAIERQIRLIDFQGTPVTITSGRRIHVSWCGEHIPYIYKPWTASVWNSPTLPPDMTPKPSGYMVISAEGAFEEWFKNRRRY